MQFRVHRYWTLFLWCWSVAAMALAAPATAPDAAKAALSRGDYATAETLYRNALLADPRSPELLTDLGIALQLQGRSTEAIHSFERALQHGHTRRAYALLAEEKCKLRELDGVRPMLAVIARDDAADPATLALVAPCYLDAEEPVQAVQVYSTLLAAPAFPRDVALIQLSKAYLLAAQFFFARLTVAPGNKTYLSAIDQARQGQAPDARGAFAEAAKHSPYFRADLSFDRAARLWREHPDDTALLYLLSVLSSENSIRQLKECGEQFPDSPYFAQTKLEMLAQQGRVEEAAQGYRELLSDHPELPDLEYNLGMLYRGQRDWEQAAAAFRRQLARDAKDERSAARLSEALEQSGRWTELRDFLAPLATQPEPPFWAIMDMAQCADKLGDAPTAIRLLAAAEKTHAENIEVHFRLLRLYRRAGDVEHAQAEDRWLRSNSEAAHRPKAVHQ